MNVKQLILVVERQSDLGIQLSLTVPCNKKAITIDLNKTDLIDGDYLLQLSDDNQLFFYVNCTFAIHSHLDSLIEADLDLISSNNDQSLMLMLTRFVIPESSDNSAMESINLMPAVSIDHSMFDICSS